MNINPLIRTLLAIDPGNEESGFVIYDLVQDKYLSFGKVSNWEIMALIRKGDFDHAVIEMIASYGMAVGATVFETCVWIGRIEQRLIDTQNIVPDKIFRREVKITLCGNPRAKDTNITQAIKDRYPATGGGKTPQVGTKSQPGPLFGFKADIWQAAGVALTWQEKHWTPAPGSPSKETVK